MNEMIGFLVLRPTFLTLTRRPSTIIPVNRYISTIIPPFNTQYINPYWLIKC